MMTRIFAIAALLALMVGCGTPSPTPTCQPGRTIACPCLNGGEGAQTCQADGTYGACRCAGVDGPTPPMQSSVETVPIDGGAATLIVARRDIMDAGDPSAAGATTQGGMLSDPSFALVAQVDLQPEGRRFSYPIGIIIPLEHPLEPGTPLLPLVLDRTTMRWIPDDGVNGIPTQAIVLGDGRHAWFTADHFSEHASAAPTLSPVIPEAIGSENGVTFSCIHEDAFATWDGPPASFHAVAHALSTGGWPALRDDVFREDTFHEAFRFMLIDMGSGNGRSTVARVEEFTDDVEQYLNPVDRSLTIDELLRGARVAALARGGASALTWLAKMDGWIERLHFSDVVLGVKVSRTVVETIYLTSLLHAVQDEQIVALQRWVHETGLDADPAISRALAGAIADVRASQTRTENAFGRAMRAVAIGWRGVPVGVSELFREGLVLGMSRSIQSAFVNAVGESALPTGVFIPLAVVLIVGDYSVGVIKEQARRCAYMTLYQAYRVRASPSDSVPEIPLTAFLELARNADTVYAHNWLVSSILPERVETYHALRRVWWHDRVTMVENQLEGVAQERVRSLQRSPDALLPDSPWSCASDRLSRVRWHAGLRQTETCPETCADVGTTEGAVCRTRVAPPCGGDLSVGTSCRVSGAGCTSSGTYVCTSGRVTCSAPGCTAARSVRVITPNGGETLRVGVPTTVQWSSSGAISAVRVELFEGAATADVLAATQSNGASGGSLSFTGLERHAGRRFRLRVSVVGDAAVEDYSDATFSVIGSSPCGGDPMIGAICSVGVGLCRHEGMFACSSGVRQCSATAGARATEICGNGIDEDCDGSDLACPRPCAGDSRIGTACVAGVGACSRSGMWTCRSGMTACDATSASAESEVCNNRDDNCNGVIDEGVYLDCYSGPAATRDVGVCRAGRAQCVAGVFGGCVGEVGPAAEVCGNGVDENCDGRDDPCAIPCAGDSRIGTSCTVGAGACARTGAWVCRSGAAVCDATPGPGGVETCTNHVDDDCDGLFDCGDPDCATDSACRICMYNGCFDRSLTSGGYCDSRIRVACGTVAGCAAEVGRTDCETLYPHAMGSCFGGSCLLGSGSCDRGWANCDGVDTNGCETNVDTSTTNCGACGNRCTSPTGTPACTAGICSVGSCPAGSLDCDGRTDNGCEINSNIDGFNCGACRTVCGAGASCMSGVCRCPVGSSATYCPTGCFDLQTSAGNCGACGNVCPVGTRCIAGGCSTGCATGLVDCSGVCADFQTNRDHCGRCHNQCSWNPHATPFCAAAVCGQTCDSGFGDCDGNATNGCELDLRSDPTNCGACGRACGTGIACSVGTCGVDPITQVSGSMTHTCALRRSGRVLCFGSGGGSLGNGGVYYSLTPVMVVGLDDAVQVDVGQYTSCAVRTGGGVVCWGTNSYGMVGDGTTTQRLVPTPVVGITDAVEVSVGYSSVCARRRGGGVMCWGTGAAVSSLTPVAVSGISDAVQLAVGRGTACARRSGGGVMCWGANTNGALGDGTTVASSPTPVSVSGLTDAVQIEFESGFGCAVRATGAVVCWGDNTSGQLGDGTSRAARTPVTVMLGGITGVTGVACGEGFTCVRTSAGAVYCWGRAAYGVLGDGSTANRSTPSTPALSSGTTAITAGDLHVCAVTTAGGLLCWGNNGGRLGDGTSADRSTPTATIGL